MSLPASATASHGRIFQSSLWKFEWVVAAMAAEIDGGFGDMFDEV
jgi:hypothetical protein